MRVFCVLLVFASVFVVGCSKNDSENSQEASPVGDVLVEEALIYYTCPMDSHNHVHSKEPGKCPECQMTLVKGVTTSVEKMDFYGCPMEIHSHIRGQEPGKCPECSMALMPMRLVK